MCLAHHLARPLTPYLVAITRHHKEPASYFKEMMHGYSTFP